MTLVYTVVPYGPAFAALPVDTDGVDTDGDGDPNNDFVYAHLTGGDGFAKMADGFELYTFGFADHTIRRWRCCIRTRTRFGRPSCATAC